MFDFLKHKPKKAIPTFEPLGIDIHCHLLPGVDDGSKSNEETLACMQVMNDAGFKSVICTPHYQYPRFPNEETDILNRFDSLRIDLNGEGSPVKPQLIGVAGEYRVAGTPFKEPEESTSVLTIKKVDRRRKAVVCSCDFAIVYYDPSGHHFLQYNKGNGGFGFQHRSFRYDVDGLAEDIRHVDNGWNELRDEYLRLKNADTQSKRSFVLYVEAVNNVHRRLLGSRPTPLDAYFSLSLGGIGVPEPFRYSDSPVRGIYDIGSGRLFRRAWS